jgi:hypothetical protein
MKLIFVLCLALGLIGCKSEIDKCTDAAVAGWKAEQSRLAMEIEQNKNKEKTIADLYGINQVELDKRTITEVEADSRLRCLRASPK